MDWSKAIQIDRNWPSQILTHHFSDVNGKVAVCVYSVRAKGTQILSEGIVDMLHELIPEFALGKKRMDELATPMKIAYMSSQYFGDTDPIRDGKYGELLLFALVEATLGCKMVAHKIRALTNPNDQVKGGDGIFLGEYMLATGQLEPAYLIGESKVVKDFNKGLPSAFSSVYRFHDEESLLTRSTEFLVATDNLILNNDIDIDELYNRLNPSTEQFSKQILVHPILIMYDSEALRECEIKASNKDELESMLEVELQKRKDAFTKSINTQLANYPRVKTIHLHFFMIPFNDVDNFRKSMYIKIHNGTSYRPKPKKR